MRKKLSCLFLFVFLSTKACFSQFLLDLSEVQLRKKVKQDFGPYTKIESPYNPNGVYSLYWKADDSDWGVIFSKEQITEVLLIFPKSQTALNTCIQDFNTKYVIISEKEWRAYLEGKVFKIRLLYAGEVSKRPFIDVNKIE